MPIKTYSTTANNNTNSPPNGFPIGTTKVSQYDDVGRQIMADIRAFYEAPQWRDMGHTPTFASTTSFTVAGNLTAFYRVNQRIKINDSSTLYGTITAATFSTPNTTVTVTLDSGSISASIASVELGINPDNAPIHYSAIANAPAGYTHPAGSVQAFAGSSAPAGWALCAGQAISRTTFAALFAVIGTTYGVGDGSTTFNVPDLRGRAIAGVDNMNGTAANRITAGVSGITGTTLGAAGGSEAMQQHNHAVTDPGHTHTSPKANSGSGNDPTVSGIGSIPFTPNYVTGSSTTGITIQNTGTGSSQNVQPTIVLNYIIKT